MSNFDVTSQTERRQEGYKSGSRIRTTAVVLYPERKGSHVAELNVAQKPLFYVHFWRLFGQTLLGHNIAMATPKIPGNQKLFERVCYI